MDKKNKIFFLVIFLLIAGSVAVTFWKIMIKKDYIIESQVDCDPESESCFVWRCDPDSEEEGEACTGDEENDVWYYKVAKRNAGNIPLCDPEKDENCEPFVCELGERGCEELLCNEENMGDYEAVCNIPEEYLKNNPSEKNGECEEGDVQCGIDNAEELTSDELISDELQTTDGTVLSEEIIKCEEGNDKCLIPTIEENTIIPEME